MYTPSVCLPECQRTLLLFLNSTKLAQIGLRDIKNTTDAAAEDKMEANGLHKGFFILYLISLSCM
jgi:hypothetical protein